MAGRFVSTWTVQVARPPGEVFDYVADVRRHHEWSPKPYRVDGLPDGPLTAGASFTSYGWIPGDKDHRNEVEVTALQRPTRFELTSHERGESFVNRFDVQADGGGSSITRTVDWARPTGVLGLLFPLIKVAVINPAVGKQMQLLKDQLDGGAGRS